MCFNWKFIFVCIFIYEVYAEDEGDLSGVKPQMVDGEDSSKGEFPWVINVLSYGQHSCGGVLIREDWVLSAAHCFVSVKSKLAIDLIAGDFIQSIDDPAKQTTKVYEIVIHPSYERKRELVSNDFAMIKVYPPFEITESVKLALLPSKDAEPVGPLVVCGWGSTSTDGNGANSDKLVKADFRIVPREQCAKDYKGTAVINQEMICAAGKGKQYTCTGDSGSGLVQKRAVVKGNDNDVVYGIVSFGKKECDGGIKRPAVFANVASAIDWINAALNSTIIDDVGLRIESMVTEKTVEINSNTDSKIGIGIGIAVAAVVFVSAIALILLW